MLHVIVVFTVQVYTHFHQLGIETAVVIQINSLIKYMWSMLAAYQIEFPVN